MAEKFEYDFNDRKPRVTTAGAAFVIASVAFLLALYDHLSK